MLAVPAIEVKKKVKDLQNPPDTITVVSHPVNQGDQTVPNRTTPKNVDKKKSNNKDFYLN